MSELINFMDGIFLEALAEVNTCMPARIETFDPVKMKAVVTPLFKKTFDGQEPVSMPPIVEVPVSCLRAGGFVIRPPYKKGDIVLLIFAQRALDNVIGTGQEADPEISRMHALDDAIVLAGLMPFTGQLPVLPVEHGDSLVLGTEDFEAKVVIKPNKDILIETTGKIDFKSGGNMTFDAPRYDFVE